MTKRLVAMKVTLNISAKQAYKKLKENTRDADVLAIFKQSGRKETPLEGLFHDGEMSFKLTLRNARHRRFAGHPVFGRGDSYNWQAGNRGISGEITPIDKKICVLNLRTGNTDLDVFMNGLVVVALIILAFAIMREDVWSGVLLLLMPIVFLFVFSKFFRSARDEVDSLLERHLLELYDEHIITKETKTCGEN
jgi:hypothetical protein